MTQHPVTRTDSQRNEQRSAHDERGVFDESRTRVPLSVLDLAPFSSGSRPADGVHNSIDLAQQTERLGYARYWLAEHHANPGISGSVPHVLAGLIAAATHDIRIGTAATLLGNYRAIQVAEAAGLLGAYTGGRFDLGIGRAPSRGGAPRAQTPDAGAPADPTAGAPSGASGTPAASSGGYETLAAHPPAVAPNKIVDGLVIPSPRFPRFSGERFTVIADLLARDGGAEFTDSVDDILAFLRGDYVSPEGVPVVATPAHDHHGVQVWVHGSTAGPSARLAGERGLRFGANYHVAPSFVLEAIAEYRESFRPSAHVERPHVIVSVDVVVAETDERAERLAAGYAPWVLSIRSGRGAIPFPTPEEADAVTWTDEDRAAVQDRVDTQFVGSQATVVEQLETLQRVTGADELLITTITHDHADRVNSYRLLAETWSEAPALVGAGTERSAS